jgi:hypothetical protein
MHTVYARDFSKTTRFKRLQPKGNSHEIYFNTNGYITENNCMRNTRDKTCARRSETTRIIRCCVLVLWASRIEIPKQWCTEWKSRPLPSAIRFYFYVFRRNCLRIFLMNVLSLKINRQTFDYDLRLKICTASSKWNHNLENTSYFLTQKKKTTQN